MGGRVFYLTYEQMLLKGTQLMNTQWVLAFVAYTGKETRIMMNSQIGNVKQSDVERMMNKFTIYVVTTLLILTLNLSIVGGFWQAEAQIASQDDQVKEMNSHYYIEFNYDSMLEGFFTFVRYFQLLSLFLPTSLFVTVEIVKTFVAYFIVSDVQLISLKRVESTKVRNISIIEDLGSLHYVFADKTGTLTCNKMEFHSMCIGATEFGYK